MATSNQSIEPSNQSMEPYYMEFLRCGICSQDFEYKDSSYPITLPRCGHTICIKCIGEMGNRITCPRDGIPFGIEYLSIARLPINYALLNLLDESSKVN